MGRLRRAYDREVLGRLLDHGMAGVDPLRAELLGGVSGRVVEIGLGSAANLPFYGGGVTELVGVEPSEGLASAARRKLERWGRPHRIVVASASSALPLDAGSFDVAVITFVLCSVRDVGAVLRESRRLVRRGGRIVLAEHVIAPDRARRAVQRALRPAWSAVLGGCDPMRDTRRAVVAEGLDAGGLAERALALPYPVSSGLVGTIPIG